MSPTDIGHIQSYHPINNIGLLLVAQELDAGCRQLIVDHHRWINAATGFELPPPCIHGNILEQVRSDCYDPNASFSEKLAQINASRLQKRRFCFTHNRFCALLTEDKLVDIDVSGLPCPDNSRANWKRLYQEGPSGPIYIVWAKKHKLARTPLLILENVPEACTVMVRTVLNVALFFGNASIGFPEMSCCRLCVPLRISRSKL